MDSEHTITKLHTQAYLVNIIGRLALLATYDVAEFRSLLERIDRRLTAYERHVTLNEPYERKNET